MLVPVPLVGFDPNKGNTMDYFNCECCDSKTWFEDSYQSITGDTLGEVGITFPNPETGKSYTTSEDCVCIPCGDKHSTQLRIPSHTDWYYRKWDEVQSRYYREGHQL